MRSRGALAVQRVVGAEKGGPRALLVGRQACLQAISGAARWRHQRGVYA
jgi:hypothetical protein